MIKYLYRILKKFNAFTKKSNKFTKKLNRFMKKADWLRSVRLVFAPLTVILTTPFRMAQLLWESRILANGKWSEYNRFEPAAAVNSLFYWTQAVNIDKYGKYGISPSLALGNFYLAKFFHLTSTSLYLFWRMNNVTIMASLFGWVLFHLTWFYKYNQPYIILIVFFMFISSMHYALIDRTNYSAVGWMFIPLGLFGTYTEYWFIAGLAWLLVSFGSFTAAYFAGLISIIASIHYISLWPLVAVLPMALKILAHFIPIKDDLLITIKNVASLIGVSKKKVKYHRNVKTKKIKKTIYFILLYGIYTLMTIYYNGFSVFNLALLVIILLFILNEFNVIRLADVQSFHFIMWSIASALIITGFNWLLFIVFLFVSNPIPYFHTFRGRVIDIVPKRKPFRIKGILDEVESFLTSVKKGEKVLFCFNNPKNKYSNIFDKYRVILEAPLYIASSKEFHLLPDWYAVMETNYEGAKSFWGRQKEDIEKNIEEWNLDYLIIYETESDALDIDSLCTSVGLKKVNMLDWSQLQMLFDGNMPYGKRDHPKWHLLRVLSKA